MRKSSDLEVRAPAPPSTPIYSTRDQCSENQRDAWQTKQKTKSMRFSHFVIGDASEVEDVYRKHNTATVERNVVIGDFLKGAARWGSQLLNEEGLEEKANAR